MAEAKRLLSWFIGGCAVVIFPGCSGTPVYLGHLRYDERHITRETRSPSIDGRAVLLRKGGENKLDLGVSVEKHIRARASLAPDQFSILMNLATEADIPDGEPRAFIPALINSRMSVTGVSISSDQHTVSLQIVADRLGADLLFTALTSPGGIKGLLTFGNSDVSLPLEAAAYQPEFHWAEIIAKRRGKKTCIGIRNVSEYPFYIYEVRDLYSLRRGGFRSAPYTTDWVCGFSKTLKPEDLSITAGRYKSVPTLISQFYRTSR